MFFSFFQLIAKAFVRLRAAVMNPFRRVVRRVQQLFNVNLITAKLITPINKKIRAILSIKPKSEEDYFSVGRFLISKKLIYFLILAGCAFVFIYFQWFAPAVADTSTTTNVVTMTYYDYDDLSLAEFSGKANIRAAGGSVVYTGDIASGVCSGNGTLWNQDGVLIYQGTFENNEYSGRGTTYYPSGRVRYEGEFTDSAFSGNGTLYYSDGTVWYTGEFSNGAFHGEGICYNERGDMIYEGNFQNGNYHGNGVSYYDSGIRKYEGEFYMGRAQGLGTLYSPTGKRIFTGQFARDVIYYESLLNSSMEEINTMLGETPTVYYSSGQTCFQYDLAQVILLADCHIEARAEENGTYSSDSWYLPQESEEELPEAGDSYEEVEIPSDSQAPVVVIGEDVDIDTGGETVQLPIMNTDNTYSLYYYLNTGEWNKSTELDYGKIEITEVLVYADGVDSYVTGAEDYTLIPGNGAVSTKECVAIDRIRLNDPTAFSNISFEQKVQNKEYIYVSSVNMAQSVYEESYEIEHIRYTLCYETNNPQTVRFLKLETY